jgi:Skp family chaperone for outer membrane proteins
VKFQLFCATLLATVLASSSAWAQAPAAQPPKREVAVIDIAAIFKGHIRFKQTMDGLKAQVQAAEDGLKKESDAIKNLVEQQKSMQPGSPEYKALEDDILKKQSGLNLDAARKKKDLMDQQDQLYTKVYEEINHFVKQYCTYYGINLVLRHSDEVIDPNDHNSVMRGINKPIVYLGPTMDITQEILAQVNRGATAAAPAAPTSPRQTGLPRAPQR